ncbi:MAG: hypothetical protein GYA17_00225, partial [Chloroflexi bacterium]|nr:hypothetical protein [Chloroflexota bacterium]
EGVQPTQVYEGNLSVDHSMRLGELLDQYVRIPYDQIAVDPNRYAPYGKIEVTVQIPDGRTFSDTENIIAPLYPYSPP